MNKREILPEVINILKGGIIYYIDLYRGIKETELILKVLPEDSSITNEDIKRFIHELVQESKIRRIEYIIPEYGATIFTFYIPSSSRIL